MAGLVLVCVVAVLWGTVGVANSLMSGRDAVDPTLSEFVRTGLGAASPLIEPGVAALLAAVVLRELLSGPETLGCALMVAAMVVLFRAERGVPGAAGVTPAARGRGQPL